MSPSIRLCSFVEPLGWPGTSAPFQELIRHPNIDGFGVTTVAIQIGKELWLGSVRGDRIAIFPLPQSPPSRQSVLAGLCHRVTLQRNQNVPRMTPAIMPPNPIRPRASPLDHKDTKRQSKPPSSIVNRGFLCLFVSLWFDPAKPSVLLDSVA